MKLTPADSQFRKEFEQSEYSVVSFKSKYLVILFTRDRIVASRLIELESKIPKEYVVRVQPAVHGEEGEAQGQDDGVGGLAGRGLSVHCAFAAGGEGTYSPATASAAICDWRVPRLAGTHPRGLDRLDGSTAGRA
jgi:hypothetical protein